MMNESSLVFLCKFTSELTEKEWQDFILTHHEVGELTDSLTLQFENIYKNNIYGDSIHVIVYADGIPLATNAHLRNDLESGVVSYQSLHTYVSPKLRRMGIFGKMSNLCLDKSRPNYVYGFPNNNSYPGFIKLGWEVVKKGVSSLYCGFASSVIKSLSAYDMIPDDYVRWRYSVYKDQYSVCCKGNVCLLLKAKKTKFGSLYLVVGRVSDVFLNEFKKVKPFILFSYEDGKSLYAYRKVESTVIQNTVHCNLDINIPIWRCDIL